MNRSQSSLVSCLKQLDCKNDPGWMMMLGSAEAVVDLCRDSRDGKSPLLQCLFSFPQILQTTSTCEHAGRHYSI